MDAFHNIINSTSFVLNIIGALITIWGIVVSLLEFLKKELTDRGKAVQLNEAIRIKLGSYLVLALEFFIAGDIVKTIITPTLGELRYFRCNSGYSNDPELFSHQGYKENLKKTKDGS